MATVAVAAAALVGILIGSRALSVLLGVGAVVFVLATVTAIAFRGTPQPGMGGFSHDQLEADRVMTEQMAVAGGPGMDAQMQSYGMLARSANPAYLRALEQHAYEVDKMIGRAP